MAEQRNVTFEQLLENNKKSIFRICKIYASTPVEPEDLFQEVIAHVWTAYSSFQGKSNANTWVYRIALNVCLRHKTKSEKRSHTIGLEAIRFEPVSPVPEDHQEAQFMALKGCIQALEELDQSIVILSLDERSYKEISNITGLTENHIAVKMKRIRKKLLNCITSKLK